VAHPLHKRSFQQQKVQSRLIFIDSYALRYVDLDRGKSLRPCYISNSDSMEVTQNAYSFKQIKHFYLKNCYNSPEYRNKFHIP
jgi:hypothetical protein